MTLEEIQVLSKKIKQHITVLSRFLFYQKKQQLFYSSKQMTAFLNQLTANLPILAEHLEEINGEAPVLEMEALLLVMKQMQEAQEKKDYVTLMDTVELQMLPAFIAIEERLVSAVGISIDEVLVRENVTWCQKKNPQLLCSLLPVEFVSEILEADAFSNALIDSLANLVGNCVDKGMAVEPTSSGYATLAVQKEGHIYYMHTNGNIVSEAMELAWEWLSQDKEEYTFYGLGLGYPYWEMLLMDQNISIKVFDTSREALLLALCFAPLGRLFQTNRFELVYDPTGNKMKRESFLINEEVGFYIFYPALHGIQKQPLKKQLEAYFVEESSVRTHTRRLDGNFKKNVRVEAKSIEELRPKIAGHRVVIVAAGPSLDKNLPVLHEKGGDVVLLAVGTVLKKLLNAGIRPDYVLMIDGYSTVYPQVAGIEDCGIPLIFLSTVYSHVSRNYQGEKYLLCQKGFPQAEQLAEKNGWALVESGGSVTTVALDLCLRLEAREIIFAGLDLAYTGKKNHASDTVAGFDRVAETGIYVDAINGGTVQTSANLKIYLDWIEKRIKNRSAQEKDITIIDATEGGAKKTGMQNMTLQQALKFYGMCM